MTEDVRLTVRGEYVGRDWLPVTRGVRRRADAPDAWLAELAAHAAVLPDGACFTHLTAARLRGWWLPPLPDDLPVFVALPPGSHRVRRPGVVAIRRTDEADPDPVAGLAVDSTATTLATCARDLEVLDLVCLVDAAIRHTMPGVTRVSADAGQRALGELGPLIPRGGRGVRRLRRALASADPRAESIYEVLLRVLHEVCGIEVEPQVEAFDEGGGFLGRGDLQLVGTRVFHEYDGGEHLKRRRQRQDRKRDRRLGNSDWIRRGYTMEDVLYQGVTILKDADVTVGRPHDPARIRAWHALIRASTFTPSGLNRLRDRLGLPSSGHREAS